MSNVLKDEYRVLTELKRTDEKVFRLKKELDQIPVEIADIEAEIQKSLDIYNGVKAQHDQIEKNLRKAESDLREKEDFLRKAESKMMEVKTNEEYQAALRENEGHKTAKGELEESVLNLISDIEKFKATLQQADSEHKVRSQKFNDAKKKLQEEGKSIQKSYEELLEKRKGVVGSVSNEVRSLYEKVAAAVKGVPIVKAENGLCTGCHVKLRPQLFNEVLGLKSFHRCPSCGKILIAVIDETEQTT